MAYWIRRAFKRASFITSIFFITASLALAGNDPYPVQAKIHISTPSPNVLSQWKNQYLEYETWRFQTPEDFEKFLLDPRFTEETRNLLRTGALRLDNEALYKSTDPKAKYLGLFQESNARVAVVLDAEARKKIPQSLFYKARRMQGGNNYSSQLFKAFKSQRQAEDYIKKSVRDESSIAKFRQITFFHEPSRETEVPIYADMWPLLNDEAKNELIQNTLSTNKSLAQGYKLSVEIGSLSDIKRVANEYSAGRNPEAIERYLKLRLKGQNKISVPLEDLLFRSARKYADTFPVCYGPNCFQSAASAAPRSTSGRILKQDFLSSRGLLNELAGEYRAVKPSEALRAGDLMLYSDLKGNIVHATNFVNPQYAYTKNGINKSSPYVFQTHAEIEKEYFKDDHFKLNVYRTKYGDIRSPALNSDTVLATPYFEGKLSNEYRSEYGLNAQLAQAERSAAIEQIPAKLRVRKTNPYAFNSLLADENFAEIHPELTVMLNARYPQDQARAPNAFSLLNCGRSLLKRIFRSP